MPQIPTPSVCLQVTPSEVKTLWYLVSNQVTFSKRKYDEAYVMFDGSSEELRLPIWKYNTSVSLALKILEVVVLLNDPKLHVDKLRWLEDHPYIPTTFNTLSNEHNPTESSPCK